MSKKYTFIPFYLPVPKDILKPKTFIKLVKEINNKNPDIIHFSGLQLEGFAVLLLSKLSKCKTTICAIRGSSADAMGFDGLKRSIMIYLENWTLYHSTICYSVSNYVASWTRVKKYSRTFFGRIYNLPGLQERKGGSCRKSIRSELNIDERDIIITSTGRIVVDKGYDVLVDAIVEISKIEKKNVHFLIVGVGDYLDTIIEKKEQYSLENMHLLGYREDIDEILSESDIFVLCTYHETLCNSVIEACNHALPVIATKVGGIPEIVEDEKNGFLVDPGDSDQVVTAMIELIRNENKRIEMGAESKRHIDNAFSKDEILSQLDDLYSLACTRKTT